MPKMKVYHAIAPQFQAEQALSQFPNGYKYVAEVEGEGLEAAYKLTQNVEWSWTKNPGVEAVRPSMHRSTSVGDVIVFEREYVVTRDGFQPIPERDKVQESINLASAAALLQEYTERYQFYGRHSQQGFRLRCKNLAKRVKLAEESTVMYLDVIATRCGFDIEVGE